MNEFEQKISRRPLRQIPAGWRAEILVATDVNRRKAREVTFAATIAGGLRKIFWPNPQAWAGLAAVWIFIFAVNFSMRDKSPAVAEKFSSPSPEMVAELKQQQRMFTELIGPRDVRDADRPKLFVPQPRSECAEFLTA